MRKINAAVLAGCQQACICSLRAELVRTNDRALPPSDTARCSNMNKHFFLLARCTIMLRTGTCWPDPSSSSCSGLAPAGQLLLHPQLLIKGGECHTLLPLSDFSGTFLAEIPDEISARFLTSFLALFLSRDAPGTGVGGRKVLMRPHKLVHGKVAKSRFPCSRGKVTPNDQAAATTNSAAPFPCNKQNYDQRRARRRSTHRDSQQPSAELAHQQPPLPALRQPGSPAATATCIHTRRSPVTPLAPTDVSLDQLTTSHELHHSDQPRSISAWLTSSHHSRDSARTNQPRPSSHRPSASTPASAAASSSSAQSTSTTPSLSVRNC